MRERLLGKHVGNVEQVRDRVDTEHARPAERGGKDLVGAGQRSRVGGRGLRRLGRPAGLDDDDRLRESHLASGREEGAGVADRLHVDDDAPGRRVVSEVVDDVAPAHVEHRAERDDRAEADLLAGAPVENGREERAALAHEADGPGCGDPRRERRVEAGRGAHHAEAVRPDDSHPVGACRREDLALQLRPFGTDLLEPCGDDHHGLDARGRALLDGGGDRHGRRRDDDELRDLGERREVRVGAHAEDAGPLLVDRVHGAAEGAADQVPEDGPADATLFLRCTDDRDGGRREERLQRVALVAQHVARAVADRACHGAAAGLRRQARRAWAWGWERETRARGGSLGRFGRRAWLRLRGGRGRFVVARKRDTFRSRPGRADRPMRGVPPGRHERAASTDEGAARLPARPGWDHSGFGGSVQAPRRGGHDEQRTGGP